MSLALAPQACLLADEKQELVMPANAKPKIPQEPTYGKATSLIRELLGPSASMQNAQKASGVPVAKAKARAKARGKGMAHGVGAQHLLI